VRIERRGAAWLLTVDRPETRNAVDPAVHDALAAALDRVEADPAPVVLTGGGGSFISGGDLKLIRARPFEETLALSQHMTALLDRVEALPVPVIAAVEGYAFGGGAEILVACHYRVAAPDAKVSFRQAAMGLSTGWGATTRLSRLVSRGAATRLLLAAEVLGAEDAQRLGLVDEVAADPLARALELAAHVHARSPRAVAALLGLLATAYGHDTDTARVAEWEAFQRLWGGPDHAEALEAFFEKRRPEWPSSKG
jgi:enoyl-CoA hydratase